MIYCFKDMETVGDEVAAHVQKLGGASQMITHPAQVEGGEGVKVFHYPPMGNEGEYVLELAEEIAAKHSDIVHVPDLRVMRLHGCIVDQYVAFGQWMPSSWLFRTMDEVQAKINDVPFPIMSIANSGERRQLNNPSEAYVDAAECLNGNGFPLASGKRQNGYVFWQIELVEQAPSWRVFVFARKYAIAVRLGSDGAIYPMDVLSDSITELLKYTYAFILDNKFDWASVEVLAGADRVRGNKSPFIGSISVNWPKNWFLNGGMIFETKTGLEWASTGIPAVRWYSVVAKELMGGLNED
jgi:hypothetical protein